MVKIDWIGLVVIMGARCWNGTLKKAGSPAAPVEPPDLRRIFHFRPDLACVLRRIRVQKGSFRGEHAI
jgi:hypothetical protein